MAPGEIPARPSARSVAALILLSLLWAVINLRSDLLPDLIPISLPYFASHAFPLVLLAVIASIAVFSSQANQPSAAQIKAQLAGGILIGTALLVVPPIVTWFAKGSQPNSARTALFCLVPVFTLIFQPHLGNSRPANNHALVAALAAFLGALFILPIDYPRSPQALLAFAALILAVASVGAANCLAEAAASLAANPANHSAPPEPAAFPLTTAIAATTAALTLTVASAIFDRDAWSTIWSTGAQHGSHLPFAASLLPALLWSLFLDLPALFLLFWSVKHLSATRLSTRYLLSPLLTILVGIVSLRVEKAIQPRTWLGLLLLACGAAYLLFAPNSEPDFESDSETGPNTLFPSNHTNPNHRDLR